MPMLSLRSPAVAAGATLTLALCAMPAPAWAMSGRDEVVVSFAFFLFALAVAIVVVIGYYRVSEQRHLTLRAMVEKGMEIPARLLGETTRPSDPRDFRRGVFLICAGIGVALFLLAVEGVRQAMFGLIPASIGVGYLVVAKIDKPRATEASSPKLP